MFVQGTRTAYGHKNKPLNVSFIEKQEFHMWQICSFALGKSREWPRLVGIWSFRCCLLSHMYGMIPRGWWRRAERWWTGSNDVGFVLCRTLLPVVLAHLAAVTNYYRMHGSKEKKYIAYISGIWKVKRNGTCRFGVQWGHSSFFLQMVPAPSNILWC